MATAEPPPSCLLGLPMADVEDQLVCEGYLRKIRGFAQNRRRWFRLTATTIGFYDQDAGRLIHGIERAFIVKVTDVGRRRFQLQCGIPFGASGSDTMLLEAPSTEVKNKWLLCLGQRSVGEGYRSQDGRIFIEGILLKMQPIGSRSRLRWFVFSEKHFAYYQEEAGEFMAACPIKQIQNVSPKGDLSFKLTAKAPFTKTGAHEVICQCETEAVRDKWLAVMNRTIAAAVRLSEFSPLPDRNRDLSDHFGVALKEPGYQPACEPDVSEGNRFIRNNDL
eukprot:m.40220 g.40220  ORF g.40220 m.40220 type:complete len:277 (+) comp11343_c1_seq1:303-1133(+)